MSVNLLDSGRVRACCRSACICGSSLRSMRVTAWVANIVASNSCSPAPASAAAWPVYMPVARAAPVPVPASASALDAAAVGVAGVGQALLLLAGGLRCTCAWLLMLRIGRLDLRAQVALMLAAVAGADAGALLRRVQLLQGLACAAGGAAA
ncbi:hypothetical protein ACRFBT_26495 [Pseudomonas aeruginosa]|uniref:hypothetical protein n=1 Tax=Pseudomonas aeruginosa TaxID=287 RepID=UPI003D6E98BF